MSLFNKMYNMNDAEMRKSISMYGHTRTYKIRNTNINQGRHGIWHLKGKNDLCVF